MLQNMRNNSNKKTSELPKQKERHIVSWSQEEDDILREQIRIHGTENWAIVASKFKDKTTRQCRRRWFTYLNSDFKKGGWSPEEDMLLCEAQKIFGNRWTEIAKVVSGRTDNAVKNRFSTLCKKRAKHEALAKENNTSFINLNNKRVIFPGGFNADGRPETASSLKKLRRSHVSDLTGHLKQGPKLMGETETPTQHLRPPFAVLAQNIHKVGEDLPNQHHVNVLEILSDASNEKTQGTFLKKDDPKILVLMQQAELLSSLALKVNSDNTDQSLENAWKALQDFLNQNKQGEMVSFTRSDVDPQLDSFKDLLEDLKNDNEDSRSSGRQPELYEDSPGSSEYSSGSTLLSQATGDRTEQVQSEICALHQATGVELKSPHSGDQNGLSKCGTGMPSDTPTSQADTLPVSGEIKTNEESVCECPNTQFSSPLQVTPLFRSLAAAIPSPKFSESERHFLLKTLGVETGSPHQSSNHSQPPLCKRVLLHSL